MWSSSLSHIQAWSAFQRPLARSLGHPSVHHVFPSAGGLEAVFFCASESSPKPTSRSTGSCSPLTDVWDHRSGAIIERKWWPEIQLAEQRAGPRAACRIDFGRRAGTLVERSSLVLAGQPSLMRQGVLERGALQMRPAWISFRVHGKVHGQNNWI